MHFIIYFYKFSNLPPTHLYSLPHLPNIRNDQHIYLYRSKKLTLNFSWYCYDGIGQVNISTHFIPTTYLNQKTIFYRGCFCSCCGSSGSCGGGFSCCFSCCSFGCCCDSCTSGANTTSLSTFGTHISLNTNFVLNK